MSTTLKMRVSRLAITDHQQNQNATEFALVHTNKAGQPLEPNRTTNGGFNGTILEELDLQHGKICTVTIEVDAEQPPEPVAETSTQVSDPARPEVRPAVPNLGPGGQQL